jgi:NAD(P)H-flavin reductase
MHAPAPLFPVSRWTRTPEARDQVRVSLGLGGPGTAAFASFRAGQYVQLNTPAGAGFFALCNLPGASPQLLVKRQPDGAAAWLVNTPELSALEVTGPMGAGFSLADVTAGSPTLVLATGSGIAPVVPLLSALERVGSVPSVHYGARTADALALLTELSAAHQRSAARVTLYVSTPDGSHAHRTGRVTDALAAPLEAQGRMVVFLCGVPAMVEEATARLTAMGTPATFVRRNV